MAHHFFTEDNVAVELTFNKLFKKLWPFMWRHKKKVYSTLALVALFVAVGRLLPFLFGYAIDEGIKNNRTDIIVWVAAAYFVLETIRAALAFWQSRYIQRFGNQVLYEIREKQIQHVQSLPVQYFEKNPSGRTVTRVTNDIYALGELFSQGFAAIFVNLIEMISIFVSLALISVVMTGVTVLSLPPLLYICFKLSQKIRFQFGATKRKLSMINAFSAESLSGIKVLQLFNRTPEARGFFNKLSREYKVLQLSTVKLFATLWPVLEGFNIFTLAVALFMGAVLHERAGLSLGHLTAYLLLLQGFFKPLKTILERYNQLQNSLASADRVFHLLDEVPENTEGQAFPENRLKGRIEFRDVSFRYAENSPYVLKHINLEIEPGMSVALVGRTGSGKTTTISLLQKLYDVVEGDILIDGLSIKSLAPRSLRPRVGVVQQDGFIFSGSIYHNISLFDPAVTRERAVWAAEQAQCQEILRSHGGLDGLLLERGANLSAGERQLIAFARVLAFNPDILILDEATANIDSVSERAIQKATEVVTRDRTSLIIAHRLSTILHSDLIVVLDHGEIVEMGTDAELMKLRGYYYRMREPKEGSPEFAIEKAPVT
ncbi:MAG: ABC transporter ATP-binding protein [Bdellovibrionales bacterium]